MSRNFSRTVDEALRASSKVADVVSNVCVCDVVSENGLLDRNLVPDRNLLGKVRVLLNVRQKVYSETASKNTVFYFKSISVRRTIY